MMSIPRLEQRGANASVNEMNDRFVVRSVFCAKQNVVWQFITILTPAVNLLSLPWCA
jgi:hypothetical protein